MSESTTPSPAGDQPTTASREHYETLLADVYDWMQGGWEERMDQNRDLFSSIGLVPSSPGAVALDLGAGTGYQAIPLAEAGFAVVAIDSSATMLAQLHSHRAAIAPKAAIKTIEGDLTKVGELIGSETIGSEMVDTASPVEAIICMGDTLTHLGNHGQVTDVIAEAKRLLEPGGRLVIGFRDGSQALTGDQRFLPVRNDQDRIFTCFLEELDTNTIRVHDVVHTRNEQGFTQNISSYNKIRLGTEWMVEQVSAAGFVDQTHSVNAGMTILIATA